MSVASVDLQIDQDADFSQTFTWIAAGVPVDLTGATARSMIRVLASDTSPQASITTTSSALGSIVLGGTTGTVVLTFSKAATALLTSNPRMIYDLFIDWPGGTSTAFLSGNVIIRPAVTH